MSNSNSGIQITPLRAGYDPERCAERLMMSYLPVLIILSLMGLACFAKRFKCVSNWIHKNESFLDFLGFIGVIGLVLSLALTIYHFNYNQAAQAQLRAENKLENISDKKAVFISKTEALRTELLFSLDICLLIESGNSGVRETLGSELDQ